MLAASPELSFTELRNALSMTDGNLTTHIRSLQEEGFVAVSKSYANRRPLTTCSLTPAGRKVLPLQRRSWLAFVEAIHQITGVEHA